MRNMWYVLYTKPKAEKKVADSLQKMDLHVYCPLVTEIRQWSDRKKKVKVPLFTSYVFVNLKEGERGKVFDVPGIVRYLYWLGKPAVVRDVEIKLIQDWLSGKEVEQIAVEHLSPGDKVYIRSGAFKDETAIIKEVGARRVRLILPELGCTVNILTRDLISNTSVV